MNWILHDYRSKLKKNKGLAGSGAASGFGIATFEMSGLIYLVILGWVM